MFPYMHAEWARTPPTARVASPSSWQTSRQASSRGVPIPAPDSARLRFTPNHQCAPLPGTQGFFECADVVKVGRPSTVEELQAMVSFKGRAPRNTTASLCTRVPARVPHAI